ncbi:D-arabinono-1,4-lactone oxidase [Sporosarcina sp. CAU 1771]
MLSINVLKKEHMWSNWSRNVTGKPDYFHYPENVGDIQEVVDSCRIRGATLRTVGASHSFSPVAKPDSDAMTLDKLSGLISFDSEVMEARFWAGTHLYTAAPLLESVGMAFENMGDIQEQTIAGAISTGTHGTGLKLGSLSAQVIAWTWVDGKGEIRQHRRADDELSKALSLSLGMMGVLIDVTIRTVPLYSLLVESYRSSFDDAVANWQIELQRNRHLEWFYFPGKDNVQVKKTNMVPLVRQNVKSKTIDFFKNGVVETAAFKVISEICRVQPRMSRKMTALSAKSIPVGTKEGIYHEILPTPRLVRFTETEYAIPLRRFEECLEEIHCFFRAHPFYVHFPIECRVTTGEDAFLSPTQGNKSAFIAFHMYKGMDNGPYFKWVHRLMEKYNGRPHFGKMNDLTNRKLRKLYPDVDRFLAVREESDPNQIFMTDYFKQLFYE